MMLPLMAVGNGLVYVGTGTTVPYFNVSNPITQKKRYDPEGKFIKGM